MPRPIQSVKWRRLILAADRRAVSLSALMRSLGYSTAEYQTAVHRRSEHRAWVRAGSPARKPRAPRQRIEPEPEPKKHELGI